MKSRIASITNETEGGLTTLARVKLELSIPNTASDQLLALKIKEATSDIEQRIRPIRRATIVEEFWPEAPAAFCAWPIRTRSLYLSRYPVESITSVVVDGVTLDPATYRVIAEKGEISLLDAAGAPMWLPLSTLATVAYVGGYLFPEDTGDDLPPVLESAAVEMLSMFWFARGRDPMLKAEENPGVSRFEYWVGSIGTGGDLPPSIQSKLQDFLRAPVFA